MVDIEFDEAKKKILEIHPWNRKSPYHKPGVNPAIFEEWSAQEEARKVVENVKAEDEAMDIVRGLVNNKKKLDRMAYIFNVSTAFSDEEIYLELRKKAKETPELFLQSIANKRQDYLGTILKGVDLQVITFNEKGFIWEKEGGLILEKAAKGAMAANQEALVDYLISEEGATDYKQLLVQIEHAEIDLQKPN
jgi:hypothetical protein